MFGKVFVADRIGDGVIVFGVDFAGFGVAFEELLGDVFAGGEHVDAVETEVGEGT